MHYLRTYFFIVAAASAFAKPSIAATKNDPLSFNEYCNETAAVVSNTQARWNCINRGYLNLKQLYASISERNPRSKWGGPLWRDDEPSLINAKNKEAFWDCVPNIDNCGIWVRVSNTQLVFIQQLLDRQDNNRWLGIGLTTFCEGTRSKCRQFQNQMAKLLPSVELSDNSILGTPPLMLPPPPPPPLP